MNLEAGNDLKIENPSAAQIADALASLPGGTNSFAILSQSEMTYLQTAGSRGEGFVLEYQDGSVDRHHQSVDTSLPLETVTKAFQLYAAEDPAWRSVVTWQHQDFSQGSSASPLLAAAIVTAAVLGLAAWWWRSL